MADVRLGRVVANFSPLLTWIFNLYFEIESATCFLREASVETSSHTLARTILGEFFK